MFRWLMVAENITTSVFFLSVLIYGRLHDISPQWIIVMVILALVYYIISVLIILNTKTAYRTVKALGTSMHIKIVFKRDPAPDTL
ncbi:unnamed protein product [Adineta ricciae]|nr:unnamed protein product [Adineta ricciae]